MSDSVDATHPRSASLSDVAWNYDPSASGPRRRAFISSDTGEPAELVAYEDGGWAVGLPRRQYPWIAAGKESCLQNAQRRAYKVWRALVDDMKEGE